jgi:hypothetical protein
MRGDFASKGKSCSGDEVNLWYKRQDRLVDGLWVGHELRAALDKSAGLWLLVGTKDLGCATGS